MLVLSLQIVQELCTLWDFYVRMEWKMKTSRPCSKLRWYHDCSTPPQPGGGLQTRSKENVWRVSSGKVRKQDFIQFHRQILPQPVTLLMIVSSAQCHPTGAIFSIHCCQQNTRNSTIREVNTSFAFQPKWTIILRKNFSEYFINKLLGWKVLMNEWMTVGVNERAAESM